MSAQDNKATVRAIYDAMAKGDRSVFAQSCHPDYVWRIAGHSSWSLTFKGQDAIRKELLTPLFRLFDGPYTARVTRLVAEDDVVVAEVQGSVMTKSGQRYDNPYCFVFCFRDGRIAEVVEYGDTDLIERVLGSYESALYAAA